MSSELTTNTDGSDLAGSANSAGAITYYAAVLAADPAAFAGYYRWDVYYHSTAGDVGYAATSPILVGDYLATHPQ